MKTRRFLPLLPMITLLAMIGPVLAGLYGAVLPAFGHLPAAGLFGPSLAPYSPAKTGPIIASSVIIGNNGKKRRGFMRGAFWRLWGDYCATP